MSFTVNSVTRATKPGHAASLVFGFDAGTAVEGWKVHVSGADGSELWCSKLDGETLWHVDSHFGPTGVPLYVTAFGSRAASKVAGVELAVTCEHAILTVTA